MVTDLSTINSRIEEHLGLNSVHSTGIVTEMPTTIFHPQKRGEGFEDLPIVMTVSQLANALRVGKNTAYSLVRSGAIRSIRVGEKSYRIPKGALEEYLQTH